VRISQESFAVRENGDFDPK